MAKKVEKKAPKEAVKISTAYAALKKAYEGMQKSNIDLFAENKELRASNTIGEPYNDALIARLIDSTNVLAKIKHEFYRRSDRYIDPVLDANNNLLESLKLK